MNFAFQTLSHIFIKTLIPFISVSGAAASSGSVDVNFPNAFFDTPLVFVTPARTWPLGTGLYLQAMPDPTYVTIAWWSAANITSAWFHWLAYGPGDIR